MKKLLTFTFAFFLIGVAAKAQSTYTSAVGLNIDFGEGTTLVGPSIKHFFKGPHAGLGEVTFGNNLTAVTLLYQYHGEIDNANGLMWFAGIGPTVLFGYGDSSFNVRPDVGLDYKIQDVPLTFTFDWRPILNFDYETTFTAARFGLGIRYAFN
ncbi:hypothetical protein [Echinicola rosea]|uniref:Outer membrane insertion C-signal n=1 Tax=Echinicola rosea TaxID=1807691 RepID=A0ABQ1V3U6_9BACT|nr:hypothetical protein [Echinicola rosea]GGF37466.1 hypothetical protein GCM10011339_27520 [Echinicola rosea]